MPFTLAHPAIVIPIKEKWPKWIDSTALILGSMSPDFEYFIRFKAQSVVGHKFSGFITLDLPLVFLVAILWHYVIKKPLILSLPNKIRCYFISLLYNKMEIRSIGAIVIFIISAMIGMFSHVLWDSFTHVNAYFVTRMPVLSQTIYIFGLKLGVYKILQHGSTLIGLGIIFIYLYLQSRKVNRVLPAVHRLKQFAYWILTLLVALAIVVFRVGDTFDRVSLNYYGIFIVSSISSMIIGIVVTSFIFHILKVYKFDVN